MTVHRTTSRADLRAFRALYQENYGFVWSTVKRMGVSPDAIDDAVQDAFLVVFRRWGDLPMERRRAWLYGIARRVSSNARRVERRRVRKHDAMRYARAGRVEVGGRLEASMSIDRFMRALQPHDRELFVLGVVEGLTGAELAAALRARPSTLYGRLAALRDRFRAEVGDDVDTSVRQARRARPEASAASWALLLPKLGAASLGPALGLGGLAAAAVAAAVVVGVGGASVPPAVAVAAATPRLPDGMDRAEPAAVPARNQPRPLEPTADAPSVNPEPRGAPARRPAESDRSDPLVGETALVRRIQAHVRAGEVEQARRLIARYERGHADGVLADAVVALKIDVLCELGQVEEARARAADLLRAHPRTPVARRLSRACGGGDSSAASVENLAAGHGQE